MRKDAIKFTNSGDKRAMNALVDMLSDARLMESVGRKALKPDHEFIKKYHERVFALKYALQTINTLHLQREKPVT